MTYVKIDGPVIQPGTLIRISRPDLFDEQDMVDEHGYLWFVIDHERSGDGDVYADVTGNNGTAYLFSCRSLATSYEYEWWTSEIELYEEQADADT